MSELYARYAAFVEVRGAPDDPWELVERFGFGTDREHFLFVAIGNTAALGPLAPDAADAFYDAHQWEPLCAMNAEQANPFKVVHPDWKYVVRCARALQQSGRDYRVVWAFDAY